MIKKFIRIRAVGPIVDAAHPSGSPLEKGVLLYAGNGRGKSTIAAVLSSLATNDPSKVLERRSIGSEIPPEICLLFEGAGQVKFADGAWSDLPVGIHVYDNDFVTENVHAWEEVRSAQRANLFQVALGTAALAAVEDERKAKAEAAGCKEELDLELRRLWTLVGGEEDFTTYLKIENDKQLNDKISAVTSRIFSAQRLADLRALLLPEDIPSPELDLEQILDILQLQTGDIDNDMLRRARERFSELRDDKAESWIREGMGMIRDDDCPFCSRTLRSVDLIEAFSAFFDAEYRRLERAVNDLPSLIEPLQDWTKEIRDLSRDRNAARIETWKQHFPVQDLQSPKELEISAAADSLLTLVAELVDAKRGHLSEKVLEDEKRAEAERMWSQVLDRLRSENEDIRRVRDDIKARLAALEDEGLQSLEALLKGYQRIQRRFSPDVTKQIEIVQAVERSFQAAEKRKTEVRGQLRRTVEATMTKYYTSVNERLKGLGARFQIKPAPMNYLGGSPRVSYSLELNKLEISVTGASGQFATALSEGDKRTMGLAFFGAAVLGDPEISQKIVVIDDAMSSMDASRREGTLKLIEEIANKAAQTIVLAHDPYFLRALQTRWRKAKVPSSQLKLRQGPRGASCLEVADLEEECQSVYASRYKTVVAAVENGVGGRSQMLDVATSLRPMLEGYLHRKFPGTLRSDVMLGTAITAIENSGDSSGLRFMRSQVSELRRLNSYAGQFHHDTNPEFSSQISIDEGELLAYASDILEFIQQH